jgi:hypothetical protein
MIFESYETQIKHSQQDAILAQEKYDRAYQHWLEDNDDDGEDKGDRAK